MRFDSLGPKRDKTREHKLKLGEYRTAPHPCGICGGLGALGGGSAHCPFCRDGQALACDDCGAALPGCACFDLHGCRVIPACDVPGCEQPGFSHAGKVAGKLRVRCMAHYSELCQAEAIRRYRAIGDQAAREYGSDSPAAKRAALLDAIDEWRSGARATAAAPVGSRLYESRMRFELLSLYRELLALDPGNHAARRELDALEGAP